MAAKFFPVEPPFSVDQALAHKFLPGDPFRGLGSHSRLTLVSLRSESRMKLSLNTDFTKLPRAGAILRAEDAPAGGSVPFDIAVLPHDERHLRRRVVDLLHGDKVLVDLPEPLMLGHGDLLVLDDGRHARDHRRRRGALRHPSARRGASGGTGLAHRQPASRRSHRSRTAFSSCATTSSSRCSKGLAQR